MNVFSSCSKQGEIVSIQLLEAGNSSHYSEDQANSFVFKSKQEFEKVYQLIHFENKEDLPAVNFINQSVLIFFSGHQEIKPYHSIEFKNAVLHKNRIEITVALHPFDFIPNNKSSLSPYLIFSFNHQNKLMIVVKDQEGEGLYQNQDESVKTKS